MDSQSSSDGKPSQPGSLISTEDSQHGRPAREIASNFDLIEIKQADIDLTMDQIGAMKEELCSRPDNPAWFKEWPLRRAFSDKSLDIYEDCLKRGDFSPCPLLMCDAGDTDMAYHTLADTIMRCVNGSRHLERKTYRFLKRNNSHLDGPVGNDCSHKCHNRWYQLWLHICSEPHATNVDREKPGCRKQTRFIVRVVLFCSSHRDDPCQPACHHQGTLEQYICQWMAAKGYAEFNQVSLSDLEGTDDLPDNVLDRQFGTYFVIDEEDPHDPDATYIAQRSTHRLGDIIDARIAHLKKEKARKSDVPLASPTSVNHTAKRS